MAQEKDITRRAKFFTRKKLCKEELLCEICKHHRHVVIVRIGCDALMFTNLKLKNIFDFQGAAKGGLYLHFWCIDTDDPPACLEQFRQVGAVK